MRKCFGFQFDASRGSWNAGINSAEMRKCHGRQKMTKADNNLSGEDYQALATFRYTLRRFMDFSGSAASQAGLPVQQHQALLAIKGHSEHERMTVGMLAERLLIAPHTATELVGRLAKAGLVDRRQGEVDRRKQTLELTVKADEILQRLSQVHLREIREMAPQLIKLLTKLQNDAV